MGQQSKFTLDEMDKILDGRMHSFIQDLGDSSGSVAVSANVEYRYTNDGLLRNYVSSPDYITSRWDSVNNKIAFPEELDTEVYVADLGGTFDPSSNAAGIGIVRGYIDDETSPKLFHEASFNYKGIAQPVSVLVSWYLGTDEGYAAKTSGVYFTYEFTVSGTVSDKNLTIYRS